MKKLFCFLCVIISLMIIINLIDVQAKTNDIKDGYYYIYSSINDKYAIDLCGGKIKNSSNIQIYKENYSDAQKWKVTKLKNGYYKIANKKNENYVLDVKGGKQKKGTNVQLHKYNGSNAEQWIIKDAGNGYYNIISKCNGLYLDIKSGKAKNKQNIQVYSKNNSKAQKFIFSPVVDSRDNVNLINGEYLISSMLSDNYVIRLANTKTENNVNIEMRKYNGSIYEYWYIEKLANGFYKIASVKNHNYVLDLRSGGKKISSNIQLYKYTGSYNQQFKIIKDTSNNYTFINRANGLALDVSGGKVSNKTNLQTYTNNGTKAQKFNIIPQQDTYKNSKQLTLSNMNTESNKLMIVAHPDDETIWGGHGLYDDKYTVVCVTCGAARMDRVYEFRNVMSKYNDDYMILGFPDLVNGQKSEWKKELPKISEQLELIINSKNWDMVVTHNPDGEYGHIHHKMLNQTITPKVEHNKLMYFGKYYKNKNEIQKQPNIPTINNYQLDFKKNVLKIYETQIGAINNLSHMVPYENWITYNDWYNVENQ